MEPDEVRSSMRWFAIGVILLALATWAAQQWVEGR